MKNNIDQNSLINKFNHIKNDIDDMISQLSNHSDNFFNVSSDNVKATDISYVYEIAGNIEDVLISCNLKHDKKYD
ncbi:hypothetical protein N9X24_03685 [Rickettsiales bacterium]|nr:hypothetical protein [Rickettsiales bacterium]